MDSFILSFKLYTIFFLPRLSQLWPWGYLPCWLLCPRDMLHLLVLGALPYFLTLQDALGASYIFPVPVLESVISPRSSVLFVAEWYLEAKIWALGVLIASGVHSL